MIVVFRSAKERPFAERKATKSAPIACFVHRRAAFISSGDTVESPQGTSLVARRRMSVALAGPVHR